MKRIIAGFVFGISCAVACGSVQYRYYGIAPLEGKSLEGTLLGPKPKDDLPLSHCNPDEREKGKCVVLFIDVWERVVSDGLECRERLKDCERRCE